MAEQALTPLCRAAWTQNVFTPKVEEKTDPKTGQTRTVSTYKLQLVFDQSVSGELQELMNAAFRVGQEAFGDNFWAMVQQGSIRWPFRNGGEINPKTGQPRYEQGTTFINCSSGSPIDVVSRYCEPADPQKKPIKITDPSQLWPGQYVKAAVTFKEYRNPSWGIACYINGLQLWHEGERWGDSFDAQSAFNAEGEAPAAQFGPGQAQQPQAGSPTQSATAQPVAQPSSPPQPSTAPGAPQAAPVAPTTQSPSAAPSGAPAPTAPAGGGGSSLL